MQKAKGIAWNPADDGLVPTIAEIDSYYRCNCQVQASLQHDKKREINRLNRPSLPYFLYRAPVNDGKRKRLT